jgi:hypothetical protein
MYMQCGRPFDGVQHLDMYVHVHGLEVGRLSRRKTDGQTDALQQLKLPGVIRVVSSTAAAALSHVAYLHSTVPRP